MVTIPGIGTGPRDALTGAITVDVEEYFHVENLRSAAPPVLWEAFPSRVEQQVDRLLDLLDEHGATGTFFVLGWVADWRPRLIEKVAGRGHEIASHGYGHEMLDVLDPQRFRADLRRARAAIEDACGRRIEGYRAPTWSIGPATEWGLDVLIEEGYRYDASIFPVRHDRYGDPASPIIPHRRRRSGGSIVEVPPLVLRALGRSFPAAGGGYLRHFPTAYVRRAVRQAAAEGRPAVLYLHPWEIDPDQPRLPVRRLLAFRHYRGIAGFERKVAALLAEGRYGRMIDVVNAFEAGERPHRSMERRAEAA